MSEHPKVTVYDCPDASEAAAALSEPEDGRLASQIVAHCLKTVPTASLKRQELTNNKRSVTVHVEGIHVITYGFLAHLWDLSYTRMEDYEILVNDSCSLDLVTRFASIKSRASVAVPTVYPTQIDHDVSKLAVEQDDVAPIKKLFEAVASLHAVKPQITWLMKSDTKVYRFTFNNMRSLSYGHILYLVGVVETRFLDMVLTCAGGKSLCAEIKLRRASYTPGATVVTDFSSFPESARKRSRRL